MADPKLVELLLSDVREWNRRGVTGADLSGADLRGADLRRANLTEANLSDAKLHIANLVGAELYVADLTAAGLTEADLTEADLFEANLFGANLAGANLSGANLFGANLFGANLAGTILTNAYLTEANLTEANLAAADLTNANLIRANLTRANLIRANLDRAVLEHAILDDTILDTKGSTSDGQTPTTESISDLTDLVVNEAPSVESFAVFHSKAEPLLRELDLAIERDLFDSATERAVQRDIRFVREELYEQDPERFIGATMGALLGRMESALLSVSEVPPTLEPILARIAAALANDDASAVAGITDDLLKLARLDDPDWLATQDQFDKFAIDTAEIAKRGPAAWFASAVGWIDENAAQVANYATLGGTAGSAIGLVVGSAVNATASAAGVSGPVGAVLGATLGWFIARFRNAAE